jgi:hypothetical protein
MDDHLIFNMHYFGLTIPLLMFSNFLVINKIKNFNIIIFLLMILKFSLRIENYFITLTYIFLL